MVMQKVDVKFGDWIEGGFNLYKNNFRTLVLASTIAFVLTMVTSLILLGPMLAGLVIITLELLRKDKPKPGPGKVFKGFEYFLNAFLFTLVWGVPILIGILILTPFPIIGQLLSLFFFYSALAFPMFGIFMIVDRKMNFWSASQKSIHTVKTNFWPFLGLSAIAGIIGKLGGIIFLFGIVLTISIPICIFAVAYQEIFDGARHPSPPDFASSTEPF